MHIFTLKKRILHAVTEKKQNINWTGQLWATDRSLIILFFVIFFSYPGLDS